MTAAAVTPNPMILEQAVLEQAVLESAIPESAVLESADLETAVLEAGILEQLAARGWVVLPEFLQPAAVAELRAEIQAAHAGQQLAPARIGRGAQHQQRTEIRGDLIQWLDGSTPAQARLLAHFESIRRQVNSSLWLGLFEMEAHFALYPPGAGYQRHLDAFQQDNPRRLSAVLYLNSAWPEAAGGELVIYSSSEQEQCRVRPEGGTLVLFLSQQILHEVLPAREWRASIAGWFRVRV